MTPYHRYTYYMLCADVWDGLRTDDSMFAGTAFNRMMHYHNKASRQFKTERERRSAFSVYCQYKHLGYDAAKYSEMWPLVVTR